MKTAFLLAVTLPLALSFGLGASMGVSRLLGYEGWFGRMAPRAPEPPCSIDALGRSLNLREDQKPAFQGFHCYCGGPLGVSMGRIAEARAELGRAILAEPEDPGRIESARGRLMAAYEESQKDLVREILDLKTRLDPDQRERLGVAFFPGCNGPGPSCGPG